jgi:hypothetical protein
MVQTNDVEGIHHADLASAKMEPSLVRSSKAFPLAATQAGLRTSLCCLSHDKPPLRRVDDDNARYPMRALRRSASSS